MIPPDQWTVDDANTCLRAWSEVGELEPHEIQRLRETILWTLTRAVPRTAHSTVVQTGSGLLLLVLDDAGGLYRATIKPNRDTKVGTKIGVERIDLARQVKRIVLAERQYYDDAGRDMLGSLWRFEFDGPDPLELQDSQTNPEDHAPRGDYRFCRLVAIAAGWAPSGAEEGQ